MPKVTETARDGPASQSPARPFPAPVTPLPVDRTKYSCEDKLWRPALLPCAGGAGPQEDPGGSLGLAGLAFLRHRMRPGVARQAGVPCPGLSVLICEMAPVIHPKSIQVVRGAQPGARICASLTHRQLQAWCHCAKKFIPILDRKREFGLVEGRNGPGHTAIRLGRKPAWLVQLRHSRAGGLASFRNPEMQGSLASRTLFQTRLALGGAVGAAHPPGRADWGGALGFGFWRQSGLLCHPAGHSALCPAPKANPNLLQAHLRGPADKTR